MKTLTLLKRIAISPAETSNPGAKGEDVPLAITSKTEACAARA